MPGLTGGLELQRQQLLGWWQRAERECGPATGLRAVFDLVAMPLFGILGFRARQAPVRSRQTRARGSRPAPACRSD